MDDLLYKGISFFNNRNYYEAHDVLENLWKNCSHLEKKVFYQGLIQASVALHLKSEKRFLGSKKVFLRAKKNLERFPNGYLNIYVKDFLNDLESIFNNFETDSKNAIIIKYS